MKIISIPKLRGVAYALLSIIFSPPDSPFPPPVSTASVVGDDYYGESDRAMMRRLPEEEKEVINEQVQIFRMEKEKLDREVAKWDDSGNDIIVMAKQMCMIMMEMTDFTR